MKRVNYCLTEPQLKRIAEARTRTGLSASELIRRAVDAYLPPR